MGSLVDRRNGCGIICLEENVEIMRYLQEEELATVDAYAVETFKTR